MSDEINNESNDNEELSYGYVFDSVLFNTKTVYLLAIAKIFKKVLNIVKKDPDFLIEIPNSILNINRKKVIEIFTEFIISEMDDENFKFGEITIQLLKVISKIVNKDLESLLEFSLKDIIDLVQKIILQEEEEIKDVF